MEKNKIKVLYLTYYYAPQNTVAAFRALKFTKYMPENSIIPYIFTSKNNIHSNSNLISDIPSEAVIFRKKSNLDSNKVYSLPITSTKSLKTKIKTILRDTFFSPDKYIWWFLSSIPQLIRIINKEKIDIILATGGPFSSNICAFLLKKFCHTPIVLDFRDPWKDNVVFTKQSFFRNFINSCWEKKCIQSADGVISVTSEIVSTLKKYHTTAIFETITNGFDPEDFININMNEQSKKFVFLYTGKYSINLENYNPQTVILSFIKFIESMNYLNVILVLIGKTDSETLNYIESFNSEHIQCYSVMNKNDVLLWQKKSNVLIHFHYPRVLTNAIAMKIFEYAAHGKPIISFNIKEGCLFELLEKYNLGETASSHDIDEMIGLFEKAYSNELRFGMTSLEELVHYSFINLTSRLAGLLRRIAKQ